MPQSAVHLIGSIRLVAFVGPGEELPSATTVSMLMALTKGPMLFPSIVLAPIVDLSPPLDPSGCVAPPVTLPLCLRLALVGPWVSAGMAGGPLPTPRRLDLLPLVNATIARMPAVTATLTDLVAFLAVTVRLRALTMATLRWPRRAGSPGSCRRSGSICLTLVLEAVSRCLGPPLTLLATARRPVASLAMRQLIVLPMGAVPLVQTPA